MTEEKKTNILPQNCILEDRKKLSVSGVTEVGIFDEETVTAQTVLGELTVRGDGLHITHLSLETGEMTVEGTIAAMSFADTLPKSSGFFSRVFR